MKRSLILLLPMVLLLVACGGSGVEADAVWGRVSPNAASTGAFYMQLTNQAQEDDALVEVRTSACETIELHESQLDENGVMRMRPVEGSEILLPAGETVDLQPGGLHVMCIGMNRPLSAGTRIPLTLGFANAEELEVEAEIRTDAP